MCKSGLKNGRRRKEKDSSLRDSKEMHPKPRYHSTDVDVRNLGPEVIFFFMLNSVEHEILNTHKYKNIEKFGFFRPR